MVVLAESDGLDYSTNSGSYRNTLVRYEQQEGDPPFWLPMPLENYSCNPEEMAVLNQQPVASYSSLY
jgi:hypothetical protein